MREAFDGDNQNSSEFVMLLIVRLCESGCKEGAAGCLESQNFQNDRSKKTHVVFYYIHFLSKANKNG